jgi:hypothetical protein
MTKQTLKHRSTGVTLTLDPAEIITGDPGAGTPALVEWKGHVGSYDCACQEGEVGGIVLPDAALAWLESDTVTSAVDAMYRGETE